ncbi:MAG: TAXI family TRAP transporter solute-binding subunit, partial [Thermoanaerobaculia bacterium]
MPVLLVGSVVAWYVTREKLPAKIRIATAMEGGLYYQVGVGLRPFLEQHAKREVEILVTQGSVEDRELLLRGEADLAILQGGAVELDGLVAVAPLYRDLVHVVVRRDRGLESIRDLQGRSVVLGPEGSGMRESAKAVLRHYGIEVADEGDSTRYFMDLATEDLDAAVVTTGLLNPDLGELLASGSFTLLPVLDAEALAIRHRYFTPQEIPRGFYREGPPVPAENVPTVATVNFVAVRKDASSLLVTSVLRALYEYDLRRLVPTAVPWREAVEWDDLPIHPAALDYFQPYRGLGILASFMESLAALKELLFAFGAGLYLLWAHWKRRQSRELETALQADKDRLDAFLSQTMQIEREQMTATDPQEL